STATITKSRHKPTYYTRHPVLPLQNKHIAIIGAGISGAATALSLAKRGYQVTVYEKNSAPALEASGNYQGMLYASWSAFGGTMMELSCNAYRYTHNLITSKLQLNTDYAPCGLIQLGHNVEQIRRNNQLLNANLPPEFLSAVNHQQIENLAGVKLDTTLTGVYYPSGLWLNPPSLIKALLQHPNISLITNCQIQAIEYQENEWQLFDDQHTQIASTPCLVLCNSHYINQFKPTKQLQIRKIRGQISLIPQQNKLQTILCGAGYITPNKATKFTLGATFQFNDHSTAIRAQDHQLNLANFAQILPDIIDMVDYEQLEGQTNFRASPHDYLPLVGPIAKYNEFVEDYAKLRQDKKARISPICQYHPNLYLNLGHGAKGMLTAPFCGELIADYITGTPLACSESLRQALHPNRLYVHELVHS
ncbi:MAG: FAD-dependent 5-carboxymethylaminomethyl-2-thiouridine(34) oxidoreductase MnmC, partial [Burkholderiales bacterium]|nr:FAD-dependent 5-carboxymethylaminomethyl-2-thiouridine(34) oxidoreductase MnmC [Burkholderiales bacterium]